VENFARKEKKMANALPPTEQQEEDVLERAIIIVEDDPSNAEALTMLLQLTDRSYQVTCFYTIKEFLANLDIIKSLHPVLFLLDYQLPPRTALDLYEPLHASEGLENVPTIILSGSRISDEEKEHLLQLGLIFVPKPYDVDDLLTTVEQAIH
jgi:DNA-binding response OmpR family regulator